MQTQTQTIPMSQTFCSTTWNRFTIGSIRWLSLIPLIAFIEIYTPLQLKTFLFLDAGSCNTITKRAGFCRRKLLQQPNCYVVCIHVDLCWMWADCIWKISTKGEKKSWHAIKVHFLSSGLRMVIGHTLGRIYFQREAKRIVWRPARF